MTSSYASSDGLVEGGRERIPCFVIGPIGSELAPVGSDARRNYEDALQVLEGVILPACELVGLTAVRADGLARAGEITEQIFRRLRDDAVVIADLTDANANVMYELGMRHTRNALTVQIGEYGRLPFDVNTIRTIQFSRSAYGLIQARDALVEILETGLNGQYDPVTATRIWNQGAEAVDRPSSDGAQDSRLAEEVQSDEDSEPPGFIDLIASAEDNYQPLQTAVDNIGGRIRELGEAASLATTRATESDARGMGMKGRLVVATGYASDVDRIATRLEGDVDAFEGALSAVSGGNIALIERLEEDPAQLSEVIDFGRAIRTLAAVAREGIESQHVMVATMQEAAQAARVMRAPVRRVKAALDRYAAALQIVDEWDRRLQILGVPAPHQDEAAADQPEGDDTQARNRDPNAVA